MIIIPDKLRRPAEVEREELRKQLAGARAEIERLVLEIADRQYTVVCAAQEIADLRELLDEARAEIESLTRSLTIVANWTNVKKTYTADEVKEFARGILDVAALEAAERGGK